MTKLADVLDHYAKYMHVKLYPDDPEMLKNAAAMLRKQDAAIKQLREALTFVSRYTNAKPAAEHAQAALAATEEFQ